MEQNKCKVIPRNIYDIEIAGVLHKSFSAESQWHGCTRLVNDKGLEAIVHTEGQEAQPAPPFEARLLVASQSLLAAPAPAKPTDAAATAPAAENKAPAA